MSLLGFLDGRAVRPDEHRPSHRSLLQLLAAGAPSSPGPLPVIAIPAARPFGEGLDALRIALDVAEEFGSRLLILCSHQARPEEFPASLVAGRRVRVALVAMPAETPLPTLQTTHHALSRNRWAVERDVAEKRNLALWFAAALGWSSVLFLDDDVCAIDRSRLGGRQLPEFGAGSVGEALAAMQRPDGPEAAGWIMTQFWDNSVVCHARRLAGLAQDSFIGGGALLVKMTSRVPFFPKIYNEDWLFFYGLLRPRRAFLPLPLGLAGMVGQKQYEPFVSDRAAFEEPGDTLAEGLFAALQLGGSADRLISSPQFWAGVLEHRRRMIRSVRRAVVVRGLLGRVVRLQGPRQAAGGAHGWMVAALHGLRRRRAAWTALTSALDVQLAIARDVDATAREIVDYLDTWRADLRRWRKALRQARPEAVLRLLDDPDVCVLMGPGGAAEFAGTAPGPAMPAGTPAGMPAGMPWVSAAAVPGGSLAPSRR